MVEWAALEMRCTRKGTEGSNPSLSAIRLLISFDVSSLMHYARIVV